ncbi:hypothetical protein ACSQ67_025615 [Phaseolus vulgaris]
MDVLLHEINFNFVEELKKKIGLDYNRPSRMSIVEEGVVKMAFELYGMLVGNVDPMTRRECEASLWG